MAKLLTPDVEKVHSLKQLLSAVVSNTKQDMQAKSTNPSRERKAMKEVLKNLLGREPEGQEIDFALAV